MRVPLSWLADHVDVDVSATTLAEKLTFAGIEIETIHRVGDDLAGILTARVLELTQHPDADRLVLVRIDAGGEDRWVVCGARNFAPGDVVPWAAPGAKLPGGGATWSRRWSCATASWTSRPPPTGATSCPCAASAARSPRCSARSSSRST